MKRLHGIFILALLLMVTLFSEFTLSVHATGENWLSGWSYRKSHVISPQSQADVNYQMLFRVYNTTGADSGANVYTNLSATVHCRPDFGDIRFTDDTGNVQLPYYIENYTATYIDVWVKVSANLTTSAQTIYMYYGNTTTASGITTYSGDNTMSFYDNFTSVSLDTTKWTAIKYGGGVVTAGTGGVLLDTHPAVSIDNAGIMSNGTTGFTFRNNTDVMIRRKEIGSPTSGVWYNTVSFGSGVPCDESGTVPPSNIYLMALRSGYNFRTYTEAHSTSGLYQYPASGTPTQLTSSINLGVTLTNYNTYDYQLLSNGTMWYTVNGVSKTTITDTTWLNNAKYIYDAQGSYSSGNYGADKNITLIFARNFVSPEPVHSTWGSEEMSSVYATFSFSNGVLLVNGTEHGNDTISFTSSDTMNLIMVVEANYTFFNWTYDGSSNTSNPFNLTITTNLTIIGYNGLLDSSRETIIVTETVWHPLVYVSIGIAVICLGAVGIEEKRKKG